jgi:hypothetical protein
MVIQNYTYKNVRRPRVLTPVLIEVTTWKIVVDGRITLQWILKDRWIHLAQNRDQWRVLSNTAMKLLVS